MANLQVKNVPDQLHRKLKQRAKRQGRTVRDLVLDAVRREVAREDFRERLARRSPVDLGGRAADLVAEERAEREQELAP
jgi:plasmid stability protein